MRAPPGTHGEGRSGRRWPLFAAVELIGLILLAFGLAGGEELLLAIGTVIFVAGPTLVAIVTQRPSLRRRTDSSGLKVTDMGMFSFGAGLWRTTERRTTRRDPSENDSDPS